MRISDWSSNVCSSDLAYWVYAIKSGESVPYWHQVANHTYSYPECELSTFTTMIDTTQFSLKQDVQLKVCQSDDLSVPFHNHAEFAEFRWRCTNLSATTTTDARRDRKSVV